FERRRRGSDADLFGGRVAGHEDRTGPVLCEDGLRPRVPRDGRCPPTGDEETVLAVEPVNDAKRLQQITVGARRHQVDQAAEPTPNTKSGSDPLAVLVSDPAADALDLTARVRVFRHA